MQAWVPEKRTPFPSDREVKERAWEGGEELAHCCPAVCTRASTKGCDLSATLPR